MRIRPILSLLAVTALAQQPVIFRSPAPVTGVQNTRQRWNGAGGSLESGGLIGVTTSGAGKGAGIEFRAMAEPPLAEPGAFGGFTQREGNTWHRIFFDKSTQLAIGYDAQVEVDGTDCCRVTIRPLSNPTQMTAHLSGDVKLKPMTTPKLANAAAQTVHAGERIALDLMASADGRQKIVDYITVTPPAPPEPAAATSTAAARDFTVDDEPLNLNVDSFARTAVIVDDRKLEARVGFTKGRGGVIWLALPGQGRYLLALAPHAGFEKAGVIRDNVIALDDVAHHYELRLATPLTSPDRAWNLYVLHDPKFRPRDPLRDAVICGLGRLENLLPR